MRYDHGWPRAHRSVRPGHRSGYRRRTGFEAMVGRRPQPPVASACVRSDSREWAMAASVHTLDSEGVVTDLIPSKVFELTSLDLCS